MVFKITIFLLKNYYYHYYFYLFLILTLNYHKRKDQGRVSKNPRENTEKRTVLRKEDINIDFNLCHNCKIKKPSEFMVKCKNKDRIRSVKSYEVFNLSLIRSNLYLI